MQISRSAFGRKWSVEGGEWSAGERRSSSQRSTLHPPLSTSSHSPLSTSGFTLIELLVVVAIIALLISILLPSLQRARDQAKTSVCMHNLKQMGLGISLYTEDNRERLPALHNLIENKPWFYTISPFMSAEESVGIGQDIMRCPGQPPECYRTYGVNYPSVFRGKRAWRFDDEFVKIANVPQDVYIAGDSTNKDHGIGYDYNSAGTIYHPLGWTLDYKYPSNGSGPKDTNAEMYLGGWGYYNLWGPVHYGGEAGNFLFAGMHVETVRIETWATSVEMWGSRKCAGLLANHPGCNRTVPGWTYAMY